MGMFSEILKGAMLGLIAPKGSWKRSVGALSKQAIGVNVLAKPRRPKSGRANAAKLIKSI